MVMRRSFPSESRRKMAWYQPFIPTGVYVSRPIFNLPPETSFRKTVSYAERVSRRSGNGMEAILALRSFPRRSGDFAAAARRRST